MGSNRNDFCNLELIESKAYSTSTYIPILLSNMVWYIQRIRITCNLGQNCWDKIENLFLNEKTLTTKLDHIEHWCTGVKWRIRIWKIEAFVEFTEFWNLVSTGFVQICSNRTFWRFSMRYIAKYYGFFGYFCSVLL